mmetsp:Transcript_56051/g.149441  ORF Transcript_56051/g.149441 Transcript_56051/m.149441 type:complete len:218 (-) Transcript_56051:228-881(-)
MHVFHRDPSRSSDISCNLRGESIQPAVRSRSGLHISPCHAHRHSHSRPRLHRRGALSGHRGNASNAGDHWRPSEACLASACQGLAVKHGPVYNLTAQSRSRATRLGFAGAACDGGDGIVAQQGNLSLESEWTLHLSLGVVLEARMGNQCASPCHSARSAMSNALSSDLRWQPRGRARELQHTHFGALRRHALPDLQLLVLHLPRRQRNRPTDTPPDT